MGFGNITNTAMRLNANNGNTELPSIEVIPVLHIAALIGVEYEHIGTRRTLDARAIPVSRLRFLQRAIQEGRTKPLSYLMDSTQMQWHRAEVKEQYLYYCQSWMLVYFLAYSSKGKYQKDSDEEAF